MSNQVNSTKVVTGKVRFCYVNVFEPTAMNEGDTPKYNICVLIPKSDTATIDKIKKAVEAAKEAGYATLNYGSFITAVINFLIMATVIFLLVKGINRISELGKKKEEAAPAAPTTKVCPFCKSEIAIEAVKCPNCTSDLPEEEKAE